jgi:hypothetical protein
VSFDGFTLSAGWRQIREAIEVKLARYLATGDTIILCRSADRWFQ